MEINTTFYRRHRKGTYARWLDATPDAFRFAVKLPRAITHEARLVNTGALIEEFRADAEQLDGKLGPLLVQLPPSLAFDEPIARSFFADLRERWPGDIACEPRHPTWFEPEADALLTTFRVGRVAADPARHPSGASPGGWPGLAYWRLHGSPRVYRSSYDESVLHRLAGDLSRVPGTAWCVFDNTASGAAADNALSLKALLPPSDASVTREDAPHA